MTILEVVVASQAAQIDVRRPRFSTLWDHYPVGMPAPEVYQLVGGNAYELYQENPTAYANACALRLSRAFSYGGLEITSTARGYKVQGGDGKRYLLRVVDIIALVKANFGAPDMEVTPQGSDVSDQFRGKTGVLIFEVSGWGNATGHVTLWNGSDCGDSCYFVHGQPGATTTKVLFWELK